MKSNIKSILHILCSKKEDLKTNFIIIKKYIKAKCIEIENF